MLKNIVKRITQAIVPAILALVLIATPVLAAYYAAIQVITTTTAYTMLPVRTVMDNDFLATNNYITASGRDVQVQLAGANLSRMLTDEDTFFASAMPAASTNNFRYLTDETATDFSIIIGYDGYITVADAVALELGNDFEVEHSGYTDTAAGANKNLVYKQDAFRTYVSGAGSVTSEITPTPIVAAVNGGNDVVNQLNHTVNLPAGIAAGDLLLVFFATDSNPAITFPNEGVDWIQLFETPSIGALTSFGAWYRIADGGEGATIVVATANAQMTAHTSYRITGYAGVPEAGVAATASSATPDPPNLAPSWGAENTLWFAAHGRDSNNAVATYPANYTNGRDDYANHAEGCGVGSARQELNAANDNPGTFTQAPPNVVDWVANTIAVRPVAAVSVTATCSSTDHTVNTIFNSGTLEISIDGAVAGAGYDSAACAGKVIDNANDWLINQNNVMPYMDYYEHNVSSVLIAWYLPNTLVINTSYDGTADAGSDADTIIDAELTQAEDYWIGALVTITGAGAAAPEDETSICTAFTAATDEVTVTPAFSAAVEAGDTYTIEFGTLIDRQGGDENARITWGVNPADTSYTVGSLISTDITLPTTTETAEDVLPTGYDAALWGMAAPTNAYSAIVSSLAVAANIPVVVMWVSIAMSLVIVTVILLYIKFRNVTVAGFVGVFLVAVFCVMGILPRWTLILTTLLVFLPLTIREKT